VPTHRQSFSPLPFQEFFTSPVVSHAFGLVEGFECPKVAAPFFPPSFELVSDSFILLVGLSLFPPPRPLFTFPPVFFCQGTFSHWKNSISHPRVFFRVYPMVACSSPPRRRHPSFEKDEPLSPDLGAVLPPSVDTRPFCSFSESPYSRFIRFPRSPVGINRSLSSFFPNYYIYLAPGSPMMPFTCLGSKTIDLWRWFPPSQLRPPLFVVLVCAFIPRPLAVIGFRERLKTSTTFWRLFSFF